MSRLSQMLQVSTGSYSTSFFIAAGLLLVAAALNFSLRGRFQKEAKAGELIRPFTQLRPVEH